MTDAAKLEICVTPIVFADHCGQRRPNIHNCRPEGAPLVYTKDTTFVAPDEWECSLGCGRKWRRNARYRGGFGRVE